jgi:triosephosphate isomerase
MRTRLICANWKMHQNRRSVEEFLADLRKDLPMESGYEVGVFSPFVYLSLFPGFFERIVFWGAQNFYPEDSGAFTGEISLPMLKDIHCPAVLVGHSERRGVFQEDDDLIARKLGKALKSGFRVIFCCGEPLEVRKKGDEREYVHSQLNSAFRGVEREALIRLDVAYEPIWAIGTGITAQPEDAQDMSREIRSWFKERFGDETASELLILYGGSVKPDNIAEIMKGDDVDGSLVGGASLEAESFLEIIRNSL